MMPTPVSQTDFSISEDKSDSPEAFTFCFTGGSLKMCLL